MTGALGTLGLILDVSVKVIPRPTIETTLSFELSEASAINRLGKLCGQALPVSAACYDGNKLYIRLSGNESGVSAAIKLLGGELVPDSQKLWTKVREQTHSFFKTDKPLWRLSLAPTTAPLSLPGKQFFDWGGAQRWLISEANPNSIYKKAAELGGHATLFRNGNRTHDIFQPLQGKLRELHMNVKLAFDPYCLFNSGRMYIDF
jgi:glycolate oxidase FAD binding subunit